VIEVVGNVLLVLSTILNLELILRYHILSGGAWKTSVMGRHVMAYMATTGLILLLASARLVFVAWLDQTDPIWFQGFRTVVFITLPAIFLWRRHLIVTAYRETVVEEGALNDSGHQET